MAIGDVFPHRAKLVYELVVEDDRHSVSPTAPRSFLERIARWAMPTKVVVRNYLVARDNAMERYVIVNSRVISRHVTVRSGQGLVTD